VIQITQKLDYIIEWATARINYQFVRDIEYFDLVEYFGFVKYFVGQYFDLVDNFANNFVVEYL